MMCKHFVGIAFRIPLRLWVEAQDTRQESLHSRHIKSTYFGNFETKETRNYTISQSEPGRDNVHFVLLHRVRVFDAICSTMHHHLKMFPS